MKHLVIIGGGFAGVSAVRTIIKEKLTDKLEIIWIDKKGVFEYLPSLPEIIAGRAGPEAFIADLEPLADKAGIKLVKSEVKEIDIDERRIKLDKESLDYDYLVLGIGAEISYFGVKGCKCAYPAYRVDDYIKILNKLERTSPGSRVTVVGAGLTGLEVAGALVNYSKKNSKDLEIVVVEKMERVLPVLDNLKASVKARRFLENMGVRLIMGTGVVRVEPDGVELENGAFLESALVIWTAGLKPSKLVDKMNVPKRGRGWIIVEPTVRVRGFENFYAPGDVNCMIINGKIAMKMAEEAMLQAEVAIKNIKRELEGRRLISHKIKFPIDFPKSLVYMGRKTLLVYGKHVAYLGKIPYIVKRYIEWKEMRRIKA